MALMRNYIQKYSTQQARENPATAWTLVWL